MQSASKVSDVAQIRIAEYISRVVGTRRIPPGRLGKVVMKLDVEGSRRPLEIMVDLVMSGALAHLDQVHVDWPKFRLEEKDSYNSYNEFVNVYTDTESLKFSEALRLIQEFSRTKVNLTHTTEISAMDDETYPTYRYQFNC